MNDMQELLNKAVRWDAAECLKALEIIQGRIREIVADDLDALGLPEKPMTASEHLPGPHDTCRRCGVYRMHHEGHGGEPKHVFVSEGAELQAGLEEAVRRATEDVDAHEEER